MNLSHLLQQREALLRQTHLANLAYAYRWFSDFTSLVTRAGLRGEVHLQPADSSVDRFWPTLTALEGNQSVIEEHFTEENIMELADLVGFITGEAGGESHFCLEEVEERFIEPIRRQLMESGVVLEQSASPDSELNRRGAP